MTVELENLEDVPPIGLGTWENDDPEQCASTVEAALELGYRHLDTAQLYENEAGVGEGIARSSVPRDEIFLATKISFKYMRPEQVIQTAKASCQRLGVDMIDLLYVHWPAGEYSAEVTLPAFDRLVEEGIVRHVGVSNFTVELLEEAQSALNHSLYAHQFELHPRFPQDELRQYGADHGIHSIGYSPFQHGQIFDDPVLIDLAEKENCSVAQLCLAWIRAKNAYPIPKATGPEHLRDNFQAREISLPEETVQQIDKKMPVERYIDPPFAPW